MKTTGLKISAMVAFLLLYLLCALCSVPRIEKDISHRSQAALEATGVNTLSTRVSGRDVVVSGYLSKTQDRSNLLRTAHVYGARTVRDSMITLPEPTAPALTIFHRIFFSLKEFKLSKDDIHQLDSLVVFIKQHPAIRIQIHGHTDDLGNPTQNMLLSQKRAEQVRDYLLALGIPASRMEVQYYGQEQPMVANTNETNRAQNRRVEIILKE